MKNTHLSTKKNRNAKGHMNANTWGKTAITILIYLQFLLKMCVRNVKINIWITFLLLKTFYLNQ